MISIFELYFSYGNLTVVELICSIVTDMLLLMARIALDIVANFFAAITDSYFGEKKIYISVEQNYLFEFIDQKYNKKQILI